MRTKTQLAILLLCAQKYNLLFSFCLFVEAPLRKDIGGRCEAVPLAVAAFLFLSLLLLHLEGEELPEPFPCAAVSDGEGSLIDARGGDRLPLLLFELSKGEPGGSSIRAIACYFAALPLIAF